MSAEAVRLSVPAEERSLGGVRHSVRSYVEQHGASTDVQEDFELAVSELATNVVEHTDSEMITVSVRRAPTSWELIVSDCDELPPMRTRHLPEVQVSTGRGLFIVQSIMDTVETVKVDGHLVIRCTMAL